MFQIFLMRYLADNPQWPWLQDKYGIATQTFGKNICNYKDLAEYEEQIVFQLLALKIAASRGFGPRCLAPYLPPKYPLDFQ